MAKYPLVAASDCTMDVKQDVVDVCQTAVRLRCMRRPPPHAPAPIEPRPAAPLPEQVEKWPADPEKSTQMIKEALDKRYGGPWHVVVGRAFAFEVTHEVRGRWRCAGAGAARCSGMEAGYRRAAAHAAAPCRTPHAPAQVKHFMHLYVAGTTGVLVWKS